MKGIKEIIGKDNSAGLEFKSKNNTGTLSYQGDVFNFSSGVSINGVSLSPTQLELKTSSGTVVKPSITYNTGLGTVTIGQGSFNFYPNEDYTGVLVERDITVDTLPIADDVTSYIIGDYNNDSPRYIVATDVSTISDATSSIIYTIYRNGDATSIIDWDEPGLGLPNKLHRRFIETERFARSNGLDLGTFGVRNVIVSAGKVWEGSYRNSLQEVDSTADEVYLLINNGDGTFGNIPSTQYPNDKYDNKSGTLQTLSDGNYGVIWIYRSMALDSKRIYFILGNGDYTEAEAVNAQPVEIHPSMSTNAMLIGKIVVLKGSNTALSIESAFNVKFAASQVTSHSGLTNLVGGHSGLYEHLPLYKSDDTTPFFVPDADNNTILTDVSIKYNDGTNDRIQYDASDSRMISPNGINTIILTDTGTSITENTFIGNKINIGGTNINSKINIDSDIDSIIEIHRDGWDTDDFFNLKGIGSANSEELILTHTIDGTESNLISFRRNDGIIVNDDQQNVDFKVRGLNTTNLFVANVGSNRVGIGVEYPKGDLHVIPYNSGTTGIIPNSNGDNIFIEGDDNVGLTLACLNTDSGYIYFADPENSAASYISYNHSQDRFYFQIQGAYACQMTQNAFGIKSSTLTDALTINSGNFESNAYARIHGNTNAGIKLTGDDIDWRIYKSGSGNFHINNGTLDILEGNEHETYIQSPDANTKIEADNAYIAVRYNSYNKIYIDDSSSSFVGPGSTPISKINLTATGIIHDGYTRLGTDAPLIKTKYFTFTSPNLGAIGTFATGLSVDSIISCNVMINSNSGNWVFPNYIDKDHPENYDIAINSSGELVVSIPTDSLNIDSRAMRCFITYKE